MKRIASALHVLALTATLALLPPVAASADGLRVAPVTLEVTAPGAATSLTLRNTAQQPKTVQIRVFRWVQVDGQERYEPTNDVVASPPMTQLAPNATQTVRVVRTASTAVRGEEAYRVIVDEVPDRSQSRAGTVAFATRLSIPVFFTEPGVRLPQVTWALRQSGNTVVLEARNAGDVRLRLANITLRRGGTVVYRHEGLFGYVLGRSSMRWRLGPVSRIGLAGMNLQATTSQGSLDATISAN